ncbi:MAG: hypothetical protein IJ770_04440 [Alphaproteobacteria bacterium]|nr:hypothetical protein [Alphaproteobacteria bacterium]
MKRVLIFVCAMFLFVNESDAATNTANINFGHGVSAVSDFNKANATCFIYEKKEYKCACSALKSAKKDIWMSRDATFFEGKLSLDLQYVYATRCKK